MSLFGRYYENRFAKRRKEVQPNEITRKEVRNSQFCRSYYGASERITKQVHPYEQCSLPLQLHSVQPEGETLKSVEPHTFIIEEEGIRSYEATTHSLRRECFLLPVKLAPLFRTCQRRKNM